MPETVTYGLIGKEDLALKSGATDTTITVTLPDGSIVVLTKISLDELIPYGSVNLNLQQLLSMLLEILTANPSTNTKGRLYYFDGTDKVIRYMNGTGVQEVVDLAATQTLTNKTLTSPRIGTAILDTNGNEVASITVAASAVNQLDMRNAATGGRPALAVIGDDTNIDLNLVPKGTGVVLNNGNPISTLPASAAAGDSIVYDGSNWVRSSTGSTGAVFAAVSGTPAQHALFRENVLKAWAYITLSGGTPSVTDNFNISSITDNGVGDFTVAFARAFTNATYGFWCHPGIDASRHFGTSSQLAGSMRYTCYDNGGLASDFSHMIGAAGKQ